jgi:hypothetical protein
VCVCVCILGLRHEKRMSRIILSSVQYFSLLSHKWHNVLENVIQHNVCFYFLYNFWLKHFSFEEELSEKLSKILIGLHVKWALCLPDFNEAWIFSTDFRKIIQNQISCKSVWWEPSCSMRTDWRTDRHDETNSRFSKFCERAWRERRKENNMMWNFKGNL